MIVHVDKHSLNRIGEWALKPVSLPVILTKRLSLDFLVVGIVLLVLSSCNKDDVIEDLTGRVPVITLDSEDGIYTVKVGRELTIAPDVANADGATYTWISDNEIISHSQQLTVSYDDPQDVYVIFRVETPAGTAQEEIKIEVLQRTPPVISLAFPSNGLKVLPNTEYIFTPDIQHADEPEFKIVWTCNGEVVSEDLTYSFCESELGIYAITVKASNEDGESSKEFDVEVVESLPYKVYFPSPSYFQPITDRSTIVGRTLYLTPILEYIDNPTFAWSVNGETVADASDRTYKFTSEKVGEYIVTVTVASNPVSYEAAAQLSRNVSRGDMQLIATVVVHCYENEDANIRNGATSVYADKVYEYLPAPGQYVNELATAGFTPDVNTQQKANEYAYNRLKSKLYVSLGGWGGYVIVGFDHSIKNSGGDYDFAIQGNAFNSANGGSNEPGIVYVMQDTNGNGLPDDEWYELRGSQTGREGTIQDYWCTYFRPAGPKMDVTWVDSEGIKGSIAYIGQFHSQDYYYPVWVEAESYTLYGTRLPANNTFDSATGYWINSAFPWGYADNMGSDCLSDDTTTGSGQYNGFKISNAIQPDGSPITLSHIDFVKVQTGVNAHSGAIGENSTEVFSFESLNK